ncbi:glycosyltransferase 8 domain-containing protein 2-like [Branchiostoma floridae]|uniref:Glycosyltransferase 8 domain-containing protein 2-like n=1 Tax=Branchiostoma floridae TaxID=7739 RepID=A0A9J7NAR5_BRAFL|nr:glycosyltransferase 8 domain-containing protein 2-like [Branchiostoma floridae]XP_035697416.1 glycosyltransferase 8 domain-containing protein 2-like [Branchiostoma floridae]
MPILAAMAISPRKIFLFLVFAGAIGLLLAFHKPSRKKLMQAPKLVFDSRNAGELKPPEGFDPAADTIPVVISTDEGRLMGAVAAINSIATNSKSPVKFYLITDKDTKDHLEQWILKTRLHSINHEIIVFNEEWVKGKINVRGGRQELASPLNYARFYLPKLLPPDFNGKILYLDDDVIVQGDITQLYNTKIDETLVMAFSEDCNTVSNRFGLFMNTYANYINFGNENVKKLGMKPGTCSFNTGVFVANMTEWKNQKITTKLEFWTALNTEENVYGAQQGGGGSQPPMMIVFYNQYSKIDPMWHIRHLGWTAGTRYSKQFIMEAKLLHWNGRFKPWGRTSQHMDAWERYYIPDPTGKSQLTRKFRMF